jgi:hypothetical protein
MIVVGMARSKEGAKTAYVPVTNASTIATKAALIKPEVKLKISW